MVRCLSVVKCYWDKCKNEVSHKVHPSKNPESFLWVCKEHFDTLNKLYTFELKNGEHYTKVEEEPMLEIFVIYFNPNDYVGKFVVRRFVNEIPDSAPIGIAGDLNTARAYVPIGKTCLHRTESDDKNIVETWI